MSKQLKDYTEVELKALAYDNLANFERAQNNIKLINDELKLRQSKTISTPEVVKSPKEKVKGK